MPIGDVFEAVVEYRIADIARIVQTEIEAGGGVDRVLNEGLIAAMSEVGRRFSEGSIFVPEMLFAAKVMQKGLEVLKPMIAKEGVKTKGKIIIGTVFGDLHDIGKNLVIMMLEGNGFQVVDLGINVEKHKFVDAVREHNTKIVGLSALLTTTLPALQETVVLLKREVPGVRVMVGGAPVTQSFADKIGADGYGPNAPSAVALANGFAA